ncbi:hypothetical protein B0H15DRAFT_175999 [Mycena belliarum]|uniref:Uncharacterized protein n=1 Tax=Mycena belliarum TaxID=1033014 RepID=A0AAD6XSQ8_9AGAR|nr:hypothetical protein B0H15DRAFT_175999 [Mycena belliae]
MAVSLLCASPEVLRAIVLHAVHAAPRAGPPREWYSLVLCCRALRRALDTPAMHALLFAQKFHVPVDACRLLHAHAKPEMARRFAALKTFRRGARCFDDTAGFTDALWVAYVMLRAEEPRQMSVGHLLWAGLPELLLLFLRRRLNHGAEENNGWPLCNETNSLVIALMWLLSSESSVRDETAATRDEVMERIRPFVLAAFRYPLSSAQEWCFGSDLPPNSKIISLLPSTPPSREVIYFGPKSVEVPSAPIYSILCYFTRLDTLVPVFPEHLSSAAPPLAGPRAEDVEHFIRECRTRFEPWDFAAEHAIPDCPRAIRQVYVPGALTGRWQGSAIVPYINEYQHWLDDPEAPETMDTFCRHPLYITLQEHFCYQPTKSPDSTAHHDGSDSAKQMDAWLAASWTERDGGVEVSDCSNTTRFYETGLRPRINPSLPVDVIVTGKTDDPYANAWGAFKVFGRVRLSDGFIVLRRESVAGLGTTLLRGYLSSSQNFAGRYRAIDTGFGVAADWEAAFSLCRMEN